MFMYEHIKRVDTNALENMKDGKNKDYLLNFVEQHKASKFRPSLNQIKFMEKNFKYLETDSHEEKMNELSQKLPTFTKANTDNWISICGMVNQFIAVGKVDLDPTSISNAIAVIKTGISQFKETELN